MRPTGRVSAAVAVGVGVGVGVVLGVGVPDRKPTSSTNNEKKFLQGGICISVYCNGHFVFFIGRVVDIKSSIMVGRHCLIKAKLKNC
jgi:hypothetical protein